LLQNCVMLSLKRIQKYDFFTEIQTLSVKKIKLVRNHQTSVLMKTVPRK
jgi:hypothetical protein